jgi:hypothetical protein
MEMGMDGGVFEPEDYAEEVECVTVKGDVLKLDLRKHENSPLVQSILAMIEHNLGVNSVGRRRLSGIDFPSDQFDMVTKDYVDGKDTRLQALRDRINNFSLLEDPLSFTLAEAPALDEQLDVFYDGRRLNRGKDYNYESYP